MTTAKATVPNPEGKRRHDTLDLLGITPASQGRRQTNVGAKDRGQTARLPKETHWTPMGSESPGTGDSKSQRH